MTLLVLSANLGHGETLRVPSEFATFDDALLTAVAGDTVLVAPGVYSGTGNRNLRFYGKDMVVISEGGAEQTTLDIQASADNPARGFLIDGGETEAAVLDGFTIVNGYMSSQPSLGFVEPHDLSAGGFKVNLASAPTIRNMIVRRCHSEYTGGGISIEIQSRPTLINCMVTSCTAGVQGGGISIETGSAPTMIDCVFTGNRSALGGGVMVDSKPKSGEGCVVLEGCTVAGNYAQRGGGVCCSTFSCGRFERFLIAGNCASELGFDLFVDPFAEATFNCSLLDSSLVHNEGVLTFGDDNLLGAVDPSFCETDTCSHAPSDLGDYGLADGSPCLADHSPCGVRIGGLDKGGCVTEPVRNVSWGQLKARLGKSRAERVR